MKKFNITLIFQLLISVTFAQQTGYSIAINMQGYSDTVAYLGYYYGDKLSVADTVFINNEKIVFEGNEALKQGMYFLVSGDKRKLIEFLVDQDQVFSLNTSMDAQPDQMIVKGSDVNKIFFDYLAFNTKSFGEIKALQQQAQSMGPENDSLVVIKNHIDSINTASIEYKLNLMKEYPESIITLLFNTMRDPEIPDIFLVDGRQDTLGAYLYFRRHYWDDIKLSDERLLRTPVFHRKLERYMLEIIPKHPDSIILEIDSMIARTETNTEMKDYLLWYFTRTYETSNIMGYDKIFVHMVDQYFTTENYDWLFPGVQQNMIERANQLRGLLIGETAPLLLMADTNSQFINMLKVEAEYLIIIFWSSTCGECQREVKALNDYYKETDLNVKIYAVNSDTTLSKWKSFIKKNQLDWIHVNGNQSLSGDYHEAYDIYSTPVIYVLDEEKRIIAKRLAADKIPAYIDRYKKVKTK